MKQDPRSRLSIGVGTSEVEPRTSPSLSFDDWVRSAGPGLRRALVARYGVDVGPDLHAEAVAYAWEHWARLSTMTNPLGYLFRVGQSAARRHPLIRAAPVFPPEPGHEVHGPEPGLDTALRSLPDDQRVAVVLVHGYGYSYADAALIVDLPVSTLRNHIHRGMARLRKLIGDTE